MSRQVGGGDNICDKECRKLTIKNFSKNSALSLGRLKFIPYDTIEENQGGVEIEDGINPHDIRIIKTIVVKHGKDGPMLSSVGGL